MSREALILRGRHLIVLDVVSTVVSFVLALALRFDAPSLLFNDYLRVFMWVPALLVAVRVGAFLLLRLYQRAWRYASIDELVAVTAAVIGSSFVAYSALYLLEASPLATTVVGFPRSVPIIDTVLMLAFAGSWRFALRIGGVGRRGARSTGGLERALIVGSGPAALTVVRQIRADPTLDFHLIGVLADDLPKGQRFMSLQVLGATADIESVIHRYSVAVVLLALPSADGRTLRRLVHVAEAAGTRCLTVPSVAEVAAGRVTMDRLREIDVEDLLRRAPARIDIESVAASFRGKRILITGAGGSIGSELSRQLLQSGPSEMFLLGRGENSVYDTMQTMHAGETRVSPVILDITERRRLEALLEMIRPEVVFHAAAHKHVHFMELFPEEAVATNVVGTLDLLEACERVGVERFVLISTDKAVEPTSVMGATKRVAEFLTLDAARRTGMRYTAVRFGNVLSSRGSVVPLFRRQLESGGPLTVTHPDVERYFMTIPEAVQLVLQAATLAYPGDTFVLDMGERVKIVDLATDLIELHGLRPDEDVDVQFVGLRPGEKLVEELLFPYERAEATSHEAVRRIVHTVAPPPALSATVRELEELVHPRHRAELLRRLQALVPEYVPAAATLEQIHREQPLSRPKEP